MGQTGQDAGEEGRVCSGKGFGADQFGDQQRMVDADQPCPFSVDRQLCRRGEISELLQHFHALLKAVLGGWQVSGFTTIQSGPPVPRILVSTNNGRRGNQATVLGTPTIIDQFPYWFDASAFGPNADGTYGNSGRAPVRLPGRNQTDLALSKNFYVSQTRLQFRTDFINAFNHTQWTTVNADCSGTTDVTQTCASFPNSTVGQITGTRNPRELQFSLKLYW